MARPRQGTGPGVVLESEASGRTKGEEPWHASDTLEQIINTLRQAEVETANGATIAEVCKKIGVTDQTYYAGGAA